MNRDVINEDGNHGTVLSLNELQFDRKKKGELIKCVVVGDSAVGKTRLICARAYNQHNFFPHLSLTQVTTTHVPTVWAIDQYRIDRKVLEMSWENVDGVDVSLRLWDTFGYHDKDRKFAYGRSDVIILCFSVTNPNSLQSCKMVWYPEIRKYCPSTPVILVGCKNDLRFTNRSEVLPCGDGHSLKRKFNENCFIFPDQARCLAKEISTPYYETSTVTFYGVKEVFKNAIRSALICRRQQKFWLSSLKNVQKPFLQKPFCPPRPQLPRISCPSSSWTANILSMFVYKCHTDVIVVAEDLNMAAHSIILASASPFFSRLLTLKFGKRSRKMQRPSKP